MPSKRGRKWVAQPYDRSTHRTVYIGSYDTRREAKDAEDQFRLKGRGARGKETCDSFAGRWVDAYPRPEDTTNAHNAERVKVFAAAFRGVKLCDVTRPAARAWALENPQRVPSVRAMFTDALNDGLVESNPFAGLRLKGSRGRRDIVALTELELHHLADRALAAWPGFGAEYRAMILFAGYVGLRPGELFALPAAHVRGESCLVDRSLKRNGLVGDTKTHRARTVVVPPAAREALSSVPGHANGLLFSSPSGKRWSPSLNHYYWRVVRTLAGRDALDWYELRHCAATMLLERGATASDVAQHLGHTDGGHLVMSTYGHPAVEGARARIRAAYAGVVEPLRSVDSRRDAG